MKHERAMGGGLRVLGWFLKQGSFRDGEAMGGGLRVLGWFMKQGFFRDGEAIGGGGGGKESSLVEGCTPEQLTPQGQPTPL